MNSNKTFICEAPIRLIQSAVDAQSKQMRGEAFFVFDLQALGITTVEGVDVSNSSPVRLPVTAEPGCIYALALSPFGGFSVMLAEHDEQTPSLLETIVVMVTDELTVKLL